MSDYKKMLRLLADGEFHSGEELGALAGMTRAAVWKRLQALERLDVAVESSRGRGYRLAGGLSLLQKDQIQDLLSEQAARSISNLYVFDEIDSTNRFLLERPQPFREVCLAERQSAGRGRRGRPWFSPYGKNLYLSISWTFHQGITVVQGLSLAVGVVVAEMLDVLGLPDICLKWPNDLLWQGRKLGGILIELNGDASGECKVVVGVGLNVAMSDLPQALLSTLDQPWVDLKSAGLRCDRNVLSGESISRLAELLSSYPERGFGWYKSAWEARNAHAGQEVLLITPAAVISGRAEGVDDDGALVLSTKLGRQVFAGGEISLRSSHGS